MKAVYLLLVPIVLIGLCHTSLLLSQQIQPKKVAGKIPWIYNYADGKREASRTGKPMFVVFRCER